MGIELFKRVMNRALEHGLLTGNYFCSECAGLMKFEDENEDILVCPNCGHSVELDEYGCEDPEDYDSVYSDDKDDDEE